MVFKTIDNYVNKFLTNHNDGADYFQRDLFCKADFYRMLLPVMTLLMNNPDLNIEEYRKKLFIDSGIEKDLKKYVLEENSVPGLSISYGTGIYNESLTIGNKEEVKLDKNDKVIFNSKKAEKNTIYDLASTSKTFTMLAILKLCEEGKIKLNDKVVWYAPQFRNLKDIRIYDLLSFQVPLKTTKRIEECSKVDEALGVLFDIRIAEKTNDSYTDMGAMVLKYVIEGVTNQTLLNYLNSIILNPLDMKDTSSLIGVLKETRVAPTNLDVKILSDGKLLLNKEPKKGMPYDPKARKLNFSGNSFVGHAGMFSSSEDMSKLGNALVNENVLKRNILNEASIVRTPNERQYHGFLNFLKNDNIKNSEVHPALSARTIASPGWCGTYFMFDPVNKLYMFIGTNRSHNRISYVNKGMESLLLHDENNKECIILPDQRKVINASKFAYEKDERIREKIIKLLFQYKVLEEMLELEKENDYQKTMHRNIN